MHKRSNLAMAITSALLIAGGPTRRTPGLSRYKPVDFIGPSKQLDQQAKLARRKARQANDAQMWERQRAKWG